MPNAFAKTLSLLFHPLLVATYMLIALLLLNPYLFGVNNLSGRLPLVGILLFTTFVMPVFMTFMLRQLDFVTSLKLEERDDRVATYIVTGFFYVSMTIFFMYYYPDMPNAYSAFLLGVTIALFVAFLLNLFLSVSTHAVGMGALVAMLFATIWQFSHGLIVFNLGGWGIVQINSVLLFLIVALFAGLVGTARMKLRAYSTQDLLGSYLIGFLTQLIALRIMF